MPSATSSSEAFDIIPYEDIKGDWKKLGSGSFGNVYKGSYLGIDVAIKEVLPSDEYDVAKYFEREWRIMKEARHPNVVLFLGLSRAPDGRVFIISEFIENGNLRAYIYDKSKPFPWKVRMSFATDIVRSLAYLHAHRCIHRDLKGENLLVTSNGRLKITDFGFARIAARNADESKRLTFCGTDSYMSPEILRGDEFDLPTDVYSLGIILCEIIARKLADDNTFKRIAPHFAIDEDELRVLVSPGCPPELIQLTMDCLEDDPSKRPTTVNILSRLRNIELEVLARPSEADDVHVGSVRFVTGARRPGMAPRIPSFGQGVAKDVGGSSKTDADDSDDEFLEALSALDTIDNPWTNGSSHVTASDSASEYSTTVIRNAPETPAPPSLSSILTIKPHERAETVFSSAFTTPLPQPSMMSMATFHTAHSVMAPSLANATEGGSTMRGVSYALIHRFTLVKPGSKRSGDGSGTPASPTKGTPSTELPRNPFEAFFASILSTSAKCDLCTKRLGWKAILECDDCGLRSHIKCGEMAPRDCGLRPPRPGSVHSVGISGSRYKLGGKRANS